MNIRIPEARIKHVDSLIASPEKRTNKVQYYLQQNPDIKHWDLMCYCTAFLMASITAYPFIKDAALKLAQIIKFFHYTSPEAVDELRANDKASLANEKLFDTDEVGGSEPHSMDTQ